MKKSSFIDFYSNLEKLTTNLVMVSFKNQIYAHYSNVEIVEIPDYLQNIPNNKFI